MKPTATHESNAVEGLTTTLGPSPPRGAGSPHAAASLRGDDALPGDATTTLLVGQKQHWHHKSTFYPHRRDREPLSMSEAAGGGSTSSSNEDASSTIAKPRGTTGTLDKELRITRTVSGSHRTTTHGASRTRAVKSMEDYSRLRRDSFDASQQQQKSSEQQQQQRCSDNGATSSCGDAVPSSSLQQRMVTTARSPRSASRLGSYTRDGASPSDAALATRHSVVAAAGAGTITSRAGSVERLSDADRKLTNFRLSRDAGKHVCVCGASAYYERESVSIAKERLRLKQESERLQMEVANLRESRERISMRLLDAEELEGQLRSRDAVLREKEAIVEEERLRVAELTQKTKQHASELDEKQDVLVQQEKNLEIQKRKLERERLDLERLADKSAEDLRRATDMSTRLSRTETRLVEEKKRLAEDMAKLEIAERRVATEEADQARRRQELEEERAEVAKQTSKLMRWEEDLRSQERALEEQRHEIETGRLLNEKVKATLDRQQHDLTAQFEQQEEKARELKERMERFKQEQQAWEEQFSNEQARVQTALQAERAHLDAEAEELTAKRKEIDDLERTLQETQKSLEKRSEQLKERESALERLRAVCEDNKRTTDARLEELDMKEAACDRERRALQQQKATLDAQRMKQEVAQLELQRLRTDFEKEKQAFLDQAREIERLQKTLTAREDAVKQRETALESHEARSEWHQSVLKDVTDARDRLELQQRDFELEKHAFEEMRATVQAQHERLLSALRMREQAVAALEVKVNERCREIQRQEALVAQRLAQEGRQLKQKLLTVSGTDGGGGMEKLRAATTSLASSPLGSFSRRTRGGTSFYSSQDVLPDFPSSRSHFATIPSLLTPATRRLASPLGFALPGEDHDVKQKVDPTSHKLSRGSSKKTRDGKKTRKRRSSTSTRRDKLHNALSTEEASEHYKHDVPNNDDEDNQGGVPRHDATFSPPSPVSSTASGDLRLDYPVHEVSSPSKRLADTTSVPTFVTTQDVTPNAAVQQQQQHSRTEPYADGVALESQAHEESLSPSACHADAHGDEDEEDDVNDDDALSMATRLRQGNASDLFPMGKFEELMASDQELRLSSLSSGTDHLIVGCDGHL